MTDFEHKRKLVCSSKSVFHVPDADVESRYLVDFEKDGCSSASARFSESVWSKFEVGKEYWIEFREVR